jgi:hypothetical protein
MMPVRLRPSFSSSVEARYSFGMTALVLEDVVEVRAAGAGEIRADLAAEVEQGVTLGANLVENDAAARGFARLGAAGLIGAFEFLNRLLLVRWRLAHSAIDLPNLFHDRRILEVAQLPH